MFLALHALRFRRLKFFGIMLRYAPRDLLSSELAGVAVLDLEEHDIFLELFGGFIQPAQVNIVDQAPPFPRSVTNLLPFAFEYVLVHGAISCFLRKLSQFAPALGAAQSRRFNASSSTCVPSSVKNCCSGVLQAFGHTFRGLSLTDKCIRPGGECGLLTGVQMTDEDDDQRRRAGLSELAQCLMRGVW